MKHLYQYVRFTGATEPRALARANTRISRSRPCEHRHIPIAAAVMWLILPVGMLKGEEPAAFEQLSAREAVRQGNQLLVEGDAPTALEAYRHAQGLRPDALEIPFVRGLGHYALEQYDLAREEFEKVAVSKNRALADDATYSVGTTYHAEALETATDPQLAIEKLENAMQRYQSVLASRPDHAEARDAIVKAASMRRQLKQMLEQQQQNQNQDQQNNEENPDDQQQPQQGQDQNERDEQQQSEAQQEQSSDESQDQQDQQQSAQQDEQDDDQEQQQVQESEAERQEQTSREQAQRRLREMMQNIRERQKRRREKPQPFRIAPVGKDW